MTVKNQNKNEKFEIVDIVDSMVTGYMDYTMASVVRVIPLSTDGLIPAHRRVLYALYQFGRKGKFKSARVVGEVLGKYHPHGDLSVYSCMQGLAVPFKRNIPLIDTQGNWGSLDGDPAAAMRYTECCLSKFAEDVFFGPEYRYNDFVPNYDETQTEPKSLSPRIPAFLVNGASGVMPGYATSIPLHDLDQVCDYILSFLKGKPDLSLIKGPSFPFKNKIVSTNIRKGLEEGRCSFKIAATYEIETESYGRFNIVFTSIPYGTDKEKVINKLISYYKQHKDEEGSYAGAISNVKDESDTNVRIVILLKKGVNEKQARELADLLIEADVMAMKDYYSMAMNVMGADGKIRPPVVMGIPEIVQKWYDYRIKILHRYFDDVVNVKSKRLSILVDVKKFIANYKVLSMAIIDNDTDEIYKIFAKHKISKDAVDYILNSTYARFKNKSADIEEEIIKTEEALKEFKGHKINIQEYIMTEVKYIKKEYGKGSKKR